MAIVDGTDWDDRIEGSDFIDDIYGYDGDDLIYGFDGDDDLFGGYDHDDLYGGAGWDNLYGGAGLDYLSGGSGDDLLVGGAGRDTLAGGAGEDVFSFTRGSSGLSTSTADTITDWNRSYDSIDMTIKGTRSNYREVSTDAFSIATAASDADYLYGDTNVRHVFLFNPDTDKGFLVSDLNADGFFETGVVLKNAGLASDMRYDFII
jgi:Ca2+-binding RTX toxin-like protein